MPDFATPSGSTTPSTPESARHDITRVLEAVGRGDAQASDELLQLLYADLRELAHARMRKEPAGMTLQATALVHEAYLRVVGPGEAGSGTDKARPRWEN